MTDERARAILNEHRNRYISYGNSTSNGELAQAINVILPKYCRLLKQEKEPAPSANDASSEQKYPKKNDSTKKAKCQEIISDALDNMTVIHSTLSSEERRI